MNCCCLPAITRSICLPSWNNLILYCNNHYTPSERKYRMKFVTKKMQKSFFYTFNSNYINFPLFPFQKKHSFSRTLIVLFLPNPNSHPPPPPKDHSILHDIPLTKLFTKVVINPNCTFRSVALELLEYVLIEQSERVLEQNLKQGNV